MKSNYENTLAIMRNSLQLKSKLQELTGNVELYYEKTFQILRNTSKLRFTIPLRAGAVLGAVVRYRGVRFWVRVLVRSKKH